MQFIKILLWVLMLVAGFIFWWSNEARTTLDLGAAIVEARTSTFVVLAFLVGFVPAWLMLRGSKWRLKRRIKSLEAENRRTQNPASVDTDKPTEVKPAIESEPNTSQKEENTKP